MWSAFMNGSGQHGGSGAGGGYVPSQGWEFVPCTRMDRADRGRGKSRSPLRRISSPPTVFSQLYEPHFGASLAGGEGAAGTQLEVLRGQMWPDQEPHQQQQQQQQPQTQRMRLKKKIEDLKKQHIQDKEGWMREKESLLREVADIQGGENRRILLDLKTVLEEVQLEVKREEEKRSELQLQYTRDRCAWDLEKAELKCRIAQLEARESAGLIQSARGTQEQRGETSTLCREREEQRRLLEDTHSTAMDLRCRLEHNERDWSRERAELLERFDIERREWESQLKDMQKKIEELYCEVRAKREGTRLNLRRQTDDGDVVQRLSVHSSSTSSSLLSDHSRSEQLSSTSSSGQSEPVRCSPLPGSTRSRNISGCVGTESEHINAGGHFPHSDSSQHKLVDELRSRGSFAESKEGVDTSELDAFRHGAPGRDVTLTDVSQDGEENVRVSPRESPVWSELSYGTDKKKNTTALNAALKEIARVSEELCSYQDEIRKKSGDRRIQPDSLCLPEEGKRLFCHDNTRLQVDEAPYDLSQIYNDLWALEKEKWIMLSPESTWQVDRGSIPSKTPNTAEPDRETPTSPEILCEDDVAAPPIPPRISSWNLSPTAHADTELHIPESPMSTMKKCHSPCTLIDRKCSSPSIVRKFGAMLQENEGKVLVDGVVTSCSVPPNSKCNVGCCHSRWSCDPTRFINTKLSTHGSVQKSFSEVNILSAGKDSKNLQLPPIVKDLPVDLLLSSLEISPSSLKSQGSKRNIMLEQKTAEFNRTLFQAEMGRSVEEQDSLKVADGCPVGCQPVLAETFAPAEASPPSENVFQPQCTDIASSIAAVHPEVTLSLPSSESMFKEVEPKWMRCGPEGQEAKLTLLSEQPQIRLLDATTSALNTEVKHSVQTAGSLSKKSQSRAATEDVFSESVLPVNTQPGQNVDGSKNKNPSEVKPQPAKAGVSLQQPSAESKQRQMTQPKHASVPPPQSDSSRPGPRVMNDHPWKPLTLAAYPRPEGSRSNYGALERILKNYETAAQAQHNQKQQTEVLSSPSIGVRQEENVTELDMLDMDPLPLPPTLRHTQMHTKFKSHSSVCVKEIHRTVQESKNSSSSTRKSFSRPPCPANRRLPSRWASRSPTSSSSASSSPCTTPVVPPSFPLQEHASSFTYSHTYHLETFII